MGEVNSDAHEPNLPRAESVRAYLVKARALLIIIIIIQVYCLIESKDYERYSETITISPVHVALLLWQSLAHFGAVEGYAHASNLVNFSVRTPILRNITTGGDITGGFCPGAGFPSCHKSIYRVSEDNFRGSACESEWMLISVKDWGLVFHNLRLHKDNKLE
jgi:hypothetical protein